MLDQFLKHLDNELSIKGWDPTVLQSLGTDFACVGFNIRVIYLSDELHLWAFEWIIVAEINLNCKLASFIWCACWSLDVDVPVGYLILNQINGDSLYWGGIKVIHLFGQSLLLSSCHLIYVYLK